jgi:hypothetical protein
MRRGLRFKSGPNRMGSLTAGDRPHDHAALPLRVHDAEEIDCLRDGRVAIGSGDRPEPLRPLAAEHVHNPRRLSFPGARPASHGFGLVLSENQDDADSREDRSINHKEA